MVTGQDLGADASPLPPGALCWVSSVQHFGHLVWEMELLPSFEWYWAASNIDAGAEDFHKDFLRSSVELYVWPYVWQQCSNQTDCMELNSEPAAATGGQLQRAVSANSEIFPVCSSSQKSQRCFQLWDQTLRSQGCWEQDRGCHCLFLEASGHPHLELLCAVLIFLSGKV